MAGMKTYITVNGVLHRTGVSSTIQRREIHNAIGCEVHSNLGKEPDKRLQRKDHE
jgi:hypothetical protein